MLSLRSRNSSQSEWCSDVSEIDTEQVKTALRDAPLAVTMERRAYNTRRGVPDVVAWLSPDHVAFSDRTLPVLLELEGSFAGAAADFEKFARRYADPQLQYHIEWPVAAEDIDPMRRVASYDIAGIPARRLGSGYSVSERVMYARLDEWFSEFISNFDRSVRVREYGQTTTVTWELTFNMYGHAFQTRIPYFVQLGSEFKTTIESYISPPTLPCAVIINDEYGGNVSTTAHHETTIEFPPLRAIRFQT